MSFLQPWMLLALPLISLPILIHLINQWRYQTKPWGAMSFLLAANRMNRGFAKIRQWLILAMRTLAVAGLILAIARPLASGLLGLTGGGPTDTTIVLLDRSPSMQQQGIGGVTKIETGRRQLGDALAKLGSKHWVTVDSVGAKATAFDSLEALLDSPALQASSSSADLPTMLQSTLDYLQSNKPGPTEVWICSDLRASDWNADSGTWSLVRDGFERLPQSVRFHLLAYPEPAEQNLSVRVTDVKRVSANEDGTSENAVLLSLQITHSGNLPDDASLQVPLQIEIEGARTELKVELNGAQTELRNQRVPLARNQETGWGKVSLPADANMSDNDYYFVFAEEPTRRVVVVSDDRAATRALEIAASIHASGETNSIVEVMAPEQLDSLVLDDAALLLWQASLPAAETSPAVENYVGQGGQVVFFPPSRMVAGGGSPGVSSFLGVRWEHWNDQERVMVENWRGDQDLLAATMSGTGLPVGQLEIGGHATLSADGELSKLATLTGGVPLVARVPTARGGVYFFTASAHPEASSLAEGGVVLFVALQRAIERGQAALGNVTQRIAEASDEPTAQWRRRAGNGEVLSTEFPAHAGVYEHAERSFAVNRSTVEDQRDLVQDAELSRLFAGLAFARVDDSAGSLSGIVREIWRLFLIAMILAMLVEAALCIPRRAPLRRSVASASI